MPEGNPGDVFIRHSGAVLDALLSDPSYDRPPSAQPAKSAASVGSSAKPPSGGGGSPSGPPKASDRINAILNGLAAPPPEPDFGELRDLRERTSTEVQATSPPKQQPNRLGQLTANMEPAEVYLERAKVWIKTPKAWAILGAVFVVLLILFLLLTGGNDSGSSQPVVMQTSRPPATSSSAAPPASTSKPIQPKSATSQCPPGSTSGMDAFDGQSGKAWDCVRAYSVDGQVLVIDLGKTYTIDSISLVPGWDHVNPDGSDEWSKHRTASTISYQFDDGPNTTYTQETLNQRKQVTSKINPTVTASQITITILKSAGDKSLNDTAISSVVITGH